MEPNDEQNTFRELLRVFFRPFRQLAELISSYIGTSILVLLARGVPAHLQEPEESKLQDIRYAFATIEFLLIFLFLTKIFGIAADLDELGESFQEFIVLLLYLICLLIYVAISRVWRWMLKIDIPARILDGYFLMEFSFLFLPSYLVLHTVYTYDPNDEEAIGSIALLFSLGWFIHMIYYFYRMSRSIKLGTGKTLLTTIFIPLISFVLLFISIFVVIGTSVLE